MIDDGGVSRCEVLMVSARGVWMRSFAASCGAALTCAASVAGAADVAVLKARPAEPATFAQRAAWDVTVASDVRYYSWSGNRGTPATGSPFPGSGSQLYIPYALQIAGQPIPDWKVSVTRPWRLGALKQTTPGLTGSVSTITDTVANGTITYLGIPGIQPFASINLNMPSGESVLLGSAANARMDPDLVEIGSFGEGWNIGPTAGFNLPLTPNLIVTASVGYTWRGTFDRERSSAEISPSLQSLTALDPGDTITGTASIGYQGDVWTWNVTGSLTEETTTTENGVELYRAGRRYFGTGTLAYQWPAQIGQTTLTASLAHSLRNEVRYLGASTLVTEAVNTNSNLYRVGLQHLFAFERMAIGPTGSFLYRDTNAYDTATLQFVPEKERWAAGGILRVAAGSNATWNARVEHVWVNEDERNVPGGQQFSVLANAFVAGSSVPVVSSTGWVFAGGVNVKF